jgi:ProP effector
MLASLLATRWPQTFWVLETRRRPLKIGIYNDVMAAGGFSDPGLRAALRAYTTNTAYRRNLVAGAERIGLDGTACGVVTPEQAAIALEQNDASFRKARQRMRGKRAGAAKMSHPAPEAPKAHALFPQKLKLAAQRRKAP